MNDKVKYVRIYGFFNQGANSLLTNASPGDIIDGWLCAICPECESFEQENDTVDKLLDDDRIFYVYSHNEPIVGEHFDFTVESYEECSKETH